MATPQPITPEAVTKHVNALLGLPVTVKKLPAQELKGALVFAKIHDEAGALVCLILADLPAAGSAGAGLSRIPAGAVQDLIRRGQLLDEDLLANYHEVANVLTVLTTAALGRRTILRTVEQSKGPLDAELTAFGKEAKQKYFMQLAVQGYPAGGINVFLSA